MRALLLFGIGAIALLGWNALQVKSFADKLDYRITGFKLPTVRKGVVTIPLTLEFFNPTNVEMKIESLVVRLFKSNLNQWVLIGSTSENPDAFTIRPNGSTPIRITPTIQTKRFGILDSLANFINTGAAPKLRVQTEVVVGGAKIEHEQIIEAFRKK